MICPICGKEICEQLEICPFCGAGLNAPAMTSESTTPVNVREQVVFANSPQPKRDTDLRVRH